MNFFNFPAEIRLQIYEELLVFPTPIQFRKSSNPSGPPLFGTRDARHFFESVRAYTTKPVRCSIYSCNRFEFCYYLILPTPKPPALGSALASFLSQIGHQNASFLRHIYDVPSSGMIV